MRTRVVQQLRTLSVGWHVGNETAFVEAFRASSIGCLEFSGYGRGLVVKLDRRDGLQITGDDPILSSKLDAIRRAVDG
jgi:hypothetical protein